MLHDLITRKKSDIEIQIGKRTQARTRNRLLEMGERNILLRYSARQYSSLFSLKENEGGASLHVSPCV